MADADHPSTFPPASVLLVPDDHGDTVGGVLVARDSGYLAVVVQFHGTPVAGLSVQFFEVGEDTARGAPVGDPVLTDAAGIACASRVVPAGLYLCAVEKQEDAVIPTASDLEDPYELVLPVGRPYADLNDGVEFWVDEAGSGAGSSDRDEAARDANRDDEPPEAGVDGEQTGAEDRSTS